MGRRQYEVMADPARQHERGPAPDLEVVYQEEFAYVWRTLQRLGIAGNDVEDLVHEVFVVVHRRLADYDPGRPIRPWLFGIAVRIAAKHRRRPRHRVEVLTEVDVAAPDSGADEQLATHQARNRLLKLLDVLDLNRRAVLIMSDIDGCPVPEIATALQIPLNTAYSRLRSARQQLAEASRRLRALGPEEP
ncbi:MAG TPA: RNA polymerase sigma factor [Kofleriaceae bacterium]|nr:RNA polymerase sigma factor [Kofleriaceae bacterium]